MSIKLKDTVREIQCKLNEKGYTLEVDGVFGPMTADAITGFIDDIIPINVEPYTDYFSLDEWQCKGGSLPPKSMWVHLKKLMEQLEILRKELGGNPITILSGYRSPEYNTKLYK